jgi:gentisate 1,2-dioxygenase
MLDAPQRLRTMADMPVQLAENPATLAEKRGRFFNSGNAFLVDRPPVPDAVFTEEPLLALNPATPTSLIACDLSKALETAFPATAPLVLARYARIGQGETLVTDFAATGSIWYVIRGTGTSDGGGERIEWAAGDIFILPGGAEDVHRASTDAVLWVVTNEPQLAFEGARPARKDAAPIEAVHYRAEEIHRQLDRIYDVAKGDDTAGFAIIFSSEKQEAIRNIMPTLTLGLNSLPPGESQRAHRHNSVALALVIQGEKCWSTVDGRRKEWAPWATTVTPPTAVHSHHNGGDRRALFLIVQDGGIYNHARTMGFSFA